MKVKIRLFKPSDAEDLYKINTEEMGYDFSIEETREKLLALVDSTKDKIYVAIVNNKVVGYIHANDYDVIYAPHMKNIMGIAVLQQYKRHGIGKALLDAVEAWARQTGVYSIRLVSGETRTGAHEFYRYCGYEDGKRQLNFKKIF